MRLIDELTRLTEIGIPDDDLGVSVQGHSQPTKGAFAFVKPFKFQKDLNVNREHVYSALKKISDEMVDNKRITSYSGKTYEEGIKDTLLWMFGDNPDFPYSD